MRDAFVSAALVLDGAARPDVRRPRPGPPRVRKQSYQVLRTLGEQQPIQGRRILDQPSEVAARLDPVWMILADVGPGRAENLLTDPGGQGALVPFARPLPVILRGSDARFFRSPHGQAVAFRIPLGITKFASRAHLVTTLDRVKGVVCPAYATVLCQGILPSEMQWVGPRDVADQVLEVFSDATNASEASTAEGTARGGGVGS